MSVIQLPRKEILSHFAVFISLLGISLLLYWSALSCGFVIDSQYVIAQNPDIKQPALYKNLLTKDFFAAYKPLEDVKLNYYRPVVSLSYALDYQFWRLNAGGYRLTDILIHGLNGFLLYFFLLKFLSRGRPAFFAALLFCIFPINECNVNEIAGRTGLLQVTFSLLSLIKLVDFWESRSKAVFVFSLIYFLLAILCREMAVFFPFFVFLVSWFYRDEKNFRKAALYSLPFVLLAGGYLVFRHFFLPLVSLSGAIDQSISLSKIYQWFVTVSGYLIQFILPRTMAVPLSALIKTNWLAFLLEIFVLAGLFILLLRKARLADQRFVVFGLLWSVAGFVPIYFALAQFERLGPILAENYAYLSSAGVAVILACVLDAFSPRGRMMGIFFLALFYGLQVGYDNSFWKNEEVLLRHFKRLEGNNRSLISEQLFMKYDFDPGIALQRLQESPSVSMKVNWLNALGIDRFKHGDYPRARKYFEQSQTLRPNAVALRGLGTVGYRMGEYIPAIDYLKQSLSLDPQEDATRKILGMVYYALPWFAGAQDEFARAVFLNPDDWDSWLRLAVCQFWTKDMNGFERSLRSALRLLNHDKGYAFRFISVELYHQNAILAAVSWLENLIKENPFDQEAMILLGKMYANIGEFDKAMLLWQKALRIDPNDDELKRYLASFGSKDHVIPENNMMWKD